MKKLLKSSALLLLCLTVSVFVISCGKSKWKDVKVEYYDFTEVPTFECVFGIECSTMHDSLMSSAGNGYYHSHRYPCSEEKAAEYLNDYSDFLIDIEGFKISQDGVNQKTLVKDKKDCRVIIRYDTTEDGTEINVWYDSPYYEGTKIPTFEAIFGYECGMDHDALKVKTGNAMENMHCYYVSESEGEQMIDEYNEILEDEGFTVKLTSGKYYIKNSFGDAGFVYMEEIDGKNGVFVFYS